jgi:hypothetical protein
VQNSRRFLVAALLGMTGGRKLLAMTLGRKLLGMTRRSGPRNVPIRAVIPNPLLPCHSEPLTPVSFRTPYSRVIPNECEESAVGNTAGGGAKLEEIPRRCAPRNDKGARKLLGTSLFPVSFQTDVRIPQLGMMNAFGMDVLDDLDDLEAAGGGGRKLRARIYGGRRCKTRGDSSSLRSSE